jgi:hypothetical protein
MSYIVPVAVLVFLAAILLVPAWLQNRARLASLRLVHAAIDRGQSLEPDVVERLLSPPKKRSSRNWFSLVCLFFGILGLCVGGALMTGAIFFGHVLDPEGSAGAGMMLGALINGSAGLAQTLLGIVSLWVFGRRGERAPDEAAATWLAQGCLFVGVSGAAVGVALAFGAQVLAGQLGGGAQAGAGMMLGALITGFSGIGLTALGIITLRLFRRAVEG